MGIKGIWTARSGALQRISLFVLLLLPGLSESSHAQNSSSPNRHPLVQAQPRRLADAANPSQVTITFDEYPLDTYISTQYASLGVIFGGSGDGPYIDDDSASDTAPILSGSPEYEGSITATFITPTDAGTPNPGVPATFTNVSFDAGYFDETESTMVTWLDITGQPIGSELNDETGFQHFTSPGAVGGFTVQIVGEEDNGFEIDNVSFQTSGVTLTDLNSGDMIADGDTALITGDTPPKMPQLQATFSNPPSGQVIQWNLTVIYTTPNGQSIPQTPVSFDGTGATWNIYDSYASPASPYPYFGGNATLTCSVGGVVQPPITFTIAGENPTPAAVLAYATSLITQDIKGVPAADTQDAFTKILYQESLNSSLAQFTSDATDDGGTPIVSFDNGVGISQVTTNDADGASLLPPNVLWNWEENVSLGWQTFRAKFAAAANYPNALSHNPAYHKFIKTVVNPHRVAAGLKPIIGYPVAAFTNTGVIGSSPTNQLLEDAVRGYNGYAGRLVLGGIPIKYANGKKYVLHEFIPNEDFLETAPNKALAGLDSDPRFWQRVEPDERPASPGNPAYVEDVGAQP